MHHGKYLHVLEGRIRVKSPLVKKSPRGASKAKQELQGIPGITQVSANPTTGSILILFDSEKLHQEQVIDILRRQGHWHNGHHSSSVTTAKTGLIEMENTVANALAKSVVEVGLQLLVSAVL